MLDFDPDSEICLNLDPIRVPIWIWIRIDAFSLNFNIHFLCEKYFLIDNSTGKKFGIKMVNTVFSVGNGTAFFKKLFDSIRIRFQKTYPDSQSC